MNINECPCYQCLCVGICKHKQYQSLINCKYILDYLYSYDANYSTTIYTNKLLKVAKAFKIQVVYIEDGESISQRNTFGHVK